MKKLDTIERFTVNHANLDFQNIPIYMYDKDKEYFDINGSIKIGKTTTDQFLQ